MSAPIPSASFKGRGAASNIDGRFEPYARQACDDGWGGLETPAPAPETRLIRDRSKTVITYNQSPDVPHDRSINPYRGCEHGCIYCFARPTHAYLGYSAGLDFETRILFKPDAAQRLEAELSKRNYRCSPIGLGTNTDPYQPAEKKLRVTRSILEILKRFQHPVSIITKGALVTRDIDILAEMAEKDLASVIVSVTSLDPAIKRTLEPRTASPAARLKTIKMLNEAGVPVGVLVAPVIPAITDHEVEKILEACAEAGAISASFILLRLPTEVKELFREWLQTHYPDRAEHVMSLMRQMRGGRDYQSQFGTRMRGTGELAELLAHRFRTACRRLGLNENRPRVETPNFRVPPEDNTQMSYL